MTDLHAAIEAAIAEDEQLARHATQGAWKLWAMEVRAAVDGTSNLDTSLPVARTYHEDGLRTHNALHIARHDPASVLRQVEAYRWILDLHPVDCRVCDPLRLAPEGFACPTRRALAHAYAIEVPE